MNVVSAGKAPWVIGTSDPPAALEILLPKQTVILSWNQFVYAEGDGEELRIAFASHDVVIKGASLDPLLPAIASHRVKSLRESVRAESFSGEEGGSSVRLSSARLKVSYEATARQTCSEMAI